MHCLPRSRTGVFCCSLSAAYSAAPAPHLTSTPSRWSPYFTLILKPAPPYPQLGPLQQGSWYLTCSGHVHGLPSASYQDPDLHAWLTWVPTCLYCLPLFPSLGSSLQGPGETLPTTGLCTCSCRDPCLCPIVSQTPAAHHHFLSPPWVQLLSHSDLAHK